MMMGLINLFDLLVNPWTQFIYMFKILILILEFMRTKIM